MAGLGFKDFAVGEVLTAADVDGYLMQQSVMRFADAAARGSALGTAVGTAVPLAEGMVTYLDDTNAMQVFDGTGWRPTGTILQVVQTVKTDTFSSTATSYTDITGLSVAITPTAATSKVLLLVQLSVVGEGSSGDGGAFRITGGNAGTYVGDAAGSRIQSVFAQTEEGTNGMPGNFMMYLDSPATTSATTYQVQGITLVDGYHVNRSDIDTDSAQFARGASSITAIEVAA